MEPSTHAVIREAYASSDFALIYATWRNALWYAERRPDSESDQFYKAASERIADILKRPDSRTRVACLSDDSDMLLGWSVLVGDRLEFVYVKIDYRRKGIGRLLVKGFKTFSEPETRAGKAIAHKIIMDQRPQGITENLTEETLVRMRG